MSSLSDNSSYPTGVGLTGRGIAPQAKILPINITGNGGLITNGSYQYGLPGGIRWAVQHGAKVISISLDMALQDQSGTDFCPAMTEDAIAYALQHNAVVVGAASNDNAKGDPAEYPGQCPGVLTVGAVDQQDAVPSWSERQPYVAVAAPGVNIPALQPDAINFNGYPSTLENDGTSTSTALVAGAAALIRSKYPSMPAREVVQRIIDTAVSPPGRALPNDATGYGVVNIQHALDVTGYPVGRNGPNPVYAAFTRWLASSQGKQYSAAQSPHTQSHTGLVAGILIAIAVIALTVVVIVVIAVNRARRRRPQPPAAPSQQPAAP
jgi:subtilisin family serine protease